MDKKRLALVISAFGETSKNLAPTAKILADSAVPLSARASNPPEALLAAHPIAEAAAPVARASPDIALAVPTFAPLMK